MGVKIVKIFFVIFVIAFLAAIFDKLNNPNEYTHPRDRSIKLY